MGLIPGLSNVVGSANPKELGVKYSQDDISSYNEKINIQIKDYSQAPADPENPGEKSIFTNPKSVNKVVLTQEEITALINSESNDRLPLEDIQVRITEGTIELSGSVNIDKIEELLSNLPEGDSANNDTSKIFDRIGLFRNDIPVYAKANVQIINNELSFKLLDVELGRISLPLGAFGEDVENGSKAKIVEGDMFSAKNLKLGEGQLEFSGRYPSVIYLER